MICSGKYRQVSAGGHFGVILRQASFFARVMYRINPLHPVKNSTSSAGAKLSLLPANFKLTYYPGFGSAAPAKEPLALFWTPIKLSWSGPLFPSR